MKDTSLRTSMTPEGWTDGQVDNSSDVGSPLLVASGSFPDADGKLWHTCLVCLHLKSKEV